MDRFAGTTGNGRDHRDPHASSSESNFVRRRGMSHRLAVGFPRTTFFLMRPRIVQSHSQSSPKATPRRPNAASDGQSASQDWPKFPNETPKVLQRETKGGQRSPQNTTEQFKLSSKEIYIHPNSRSTAAAATIHKVNRLGAQWQNKQNIN